MSTSIKRQYMPSDLWEDRWGEREEERSDKVKEVF
jgi:hypothetical protein